MEIKIEGAGSRFDGTHPLDLDERPLNGWDLHLIKKIAGVRANELQDGLQAGDYDLIIALAVIALTRSGGLERQTAVQAADALREVELGKIELIGDDEEADAGPPASSPSTEPDDSETLNVAKPPSGPPLNGDGDALLSIPTPTGHPV